MLIHEFEIDVDQISIFMWNAFQNVSLELVGINAQTLFFKCSITKKQVSRFCLLCFFEWERMFLRAEATSRHLNLLTVPAMVVGAVELTLVRNRLLNSSEWVVNCGSRKLLSFKRFSLFTGICFLFSIRSQQVTWNQW